MKVGYNGSVTGHPFITVVQQDSDFTFLVLSHYVQAEVAAEEEDEEEDAQSSGVVSLKPQV